MRTLGVGVLLICALAAFPGPLSKKKKKSEEEATQVLQLPKDPPSAVTAETARISFSVSPLSSRGLLSQQVRDALKALSRSAGSSSVVKLRAFVAGSGDMRRVQAIVSESRFRHSAWCRWADCRSRAHRWYSRLRSRARRT